MNSEDRELFRRLVVVMVLSIFLLLAVIVYIQTQPPNQPENVQLSTGENILVQHGGNLTRVTIPAGWEVVLPPQMEGGGTWITLKSVDPDRDPETVLIQATRRIIIWHSQALSLEKE